MLKRILSLILSGVLLLQVSIFTTIADKFDGNENVEKIESVFAEREPNYCADYGRNNCSKTVDVGCAKRKMYRIIKGSDDTEVFFDEEKVGSNCETDLYFWKYDGLTGLAETFDAWINTNNKRENKHRFVSEFIFNTKILLNKTNEDSAEIMKIFIKNPMYKKFLEITEKDIDKWKEKIAGKKETIDEEVESDTKSMVTGGSVGLATGAIAGWGIHGAIAAKAAATLMATAAAPALAPFVAVGGIVAGLTGFGLGYYFGKEKNTAKRLAQISKKARKKAREDERRLDVYSLAIENIFNAIRRKEYKNKDILSAQLNFNKYTPNAFIKFMRLGIPSVNKDEEDKIFENLSNSLSKRIDEYNLNKEDL